MQTNSSATANVKTYANADADATDNCKHIASANTYVYAHANA